MYYFFSHILADYREKTTLDQYPGHTWSLYWPSLVTIGKKCPKFVIHKENDWIYIYHKA